MCSRSSASMHPCGHGRSLSTLCGVPPAESWSAPPARARTATGLRPAFLGSRDTRLITPRRLVGVVVRADRADTMTGCIVTAHRSAQQSTGPTLLSRKEKDTGIWHGHRRSVNSSGGIETTISRELAALRHSLGLRRPCATSGAHGAGRRLSPSRRAASVGANAPPPSAASTSPTSTSTAAVRVASGSSL